MDAKLRWEQSADRSSGYAVTPYGNHMFHYDMRDGGGPCGFSPVKLDSSTSLGPSGFRSSIRSVADWRMVCEAEYEKEDKKLLGAHSIAEAERRHAEGMEKGICFPFLSGRDFDAHYAEVLSRRGRVGVSWSATMSADDFQKLLDAANEGDGYQWGPRDVVFAMYQDGARYDKKTGLCHFELGGKELSFPKVQMEKIDKEKAVAGPAPLFRWREREDGSGGYMFTDLGTRLYEYGTCRPPYGDNSDGDDFLYDSPLPYRNVPLKGDLVAWKRDIENEYLTKVRPLEEKFYQMFRDHSVYYPTLESSSLYARYFWGTYVKDGAAGRTAPGQSDADTTAVTKQHEGRGCDGYGFVAITMPDGKSPGLSIRGDLFVAMMGDIRGYKYRFVGFDTQGNMTGTGYVTNRAPRSEGGNQIGNIFGAADSNAGKRANEMADVIRKAVTDQKGSFVIEVDYRGKTYPIHSGFLVPFTEEGGVDAAAYERSLKLYVPQNSVDGRLAAILSRRQGLAWPWPGKDAPDAVMPVQEAEAEGEAKQPPRSEKRMSDSEYRMFKYSGAAGELDPSWRPPMAVPQVSSLPGARTGPGVEPSRCGDPRFWWYVEYDEDRNRIGGYMETDQGNILFRFGTKCFYDGVGDDRIEYPVGTCTRPMGKDALEQAERAYLGIVRPLEEKYEFMLRERSIYYPLLDTRDIEQVGFYDHGCPKEYSAKGQFDYGPIQPGKGGNVWTKVDFTTRVAKNARGDVVPYKRGVCPNAIVRNNGGPAMRGRNKWVAISMPDEQDPYGRCIRGDIFQCIMNDINGDISRLGPNPKNSKDAVKFHENKVRPDGGKQREYFGNVNGVPCDPDKDTKHYRLTVRDVAAMIDEAYRKEPEAGMIRLSYKDREYQFPNAYIMLFTEQYGQPVERTKFPKYLDPTNLEGKPGVVPRGKPLAPKRKEQDGSQGRGGEIGLDDRTAETKSSNMGRYG